MLLFQEKKLGKQIPQYRVQIIKALDTFFFISKRWILYINERGKQEKLQLLFKN